MTGNAEMLLYQRHIHSYAQSHPVARVLEDWQYVYNPTAAVDSGSIVVGHRLMAANLSGWRHSSTLIK